MFSKLGFVGAGQMAKAIGLTLVKKGAINPAEICVSCPEANLLQPWKDAGCNTTFNNGEVIEKSDTIIWAVKPQVFPLVVNELQTDITQPKFHISIMAGIQLPEFTTQISSRFKTSEIFSARVMPNIAMKVDCGCSVFTMHENARKDDKELLSKLLNSVGLCYEVPENQINAYCGLFSSGVGFMFPIIEGLSDGAVKMGIPRDQSLKIAAQTMKGAAQLILGDSEIHPGAFKDAVCSPGGTTIAGIAIMEKLGVRSALIEAVEAATKRGEELGKKR